MRTRKRCARDGQKTAECIMDAWPHYQEGRFAQALVPLAMGIGIDPTDQVLQILMQRMSRYIDNPPEDWQGYERLTKK